AFAMGCGRAIVSTSYAYAQEVLAGGRGLLANEPNPEELARLVNQILDDPVLKTGLQQRALDLGTEWCWPSVGRQYTELFRMILDDHYIREENQVNYARL
ncbi:MAG: hypothetical protein ACM3MK_01875, partial [Chitinophagales bacterium]